MATDVCLQSISAAIQCSPSHIASDHCLSRVSPSVHNLVLPNRDFLNSGYIWVPRNVVGLPAVLPITPRTTLIISSPKRWPGFNWHMFSQSQYHRKAQPGLSFTTMPWLLSSRRFAYSHCYLRVVTHRWKYSPATLRSSTRPPKYFYLPYYCSRSHLLIHLNCLMSTSISILITLLTVESRVRISFETWSLEGKCPCACIYLNIRLTAHSLLKPIFSPCTVLMLAKYECFGHSNELTNNDARLKANCQSFIIATERRSSLGFVELFGGVIRTTGPV